jgi:hypothetical protein
MAATVIEAPSTPNEKVHDWTKPQAMAIPKGGFFKDKVEQGRYGPIFPKTPACYGFSVIAKVIPGREEHLYNHAKVIEKAIADDPTTLAILKAHYLRWVIFTIKGESYMMYQGIFDTDFDKYCEDASFLFGKTGLQSAFEALEGWPADYATNPASIVKFFHEHQWPSFLEYSEHPYVSCGEINKALKLKATFGDVLDLMQ